MVRARVGTKYLNEWTVGLDRPQRVYDWRIGDMTLQVNEEQILPRSSFQWTRFDPRNTDAILGKRLERAIEHPDLIANRE